MTRPLAKNPFNKLKNVKCPACTSSGWYRQKDGTFVCKKCATSWKI